MPVQTPQEFLEQILPQKFDPSKVAGLAATVQIRLSGVNGGDWTLTIRDGSLAVQRGTSENPDMTITMKDKDYVDLVNGDLSGQKAFMTGKLKFKGDMNLGMKLQRLGLI